MNIEPEAKCPACSGKKVIRCNASIPGAYKDCERCRTHYFERFPDGSVKYFARGAVLGTFTSFEFFQRFFPNWQAIPEKAF